jgi:hypothetical protein
MHLLGMQEPMLIIEVEGYAGDDGQIVVTNHRAAEGLGTPTRLYCVGALGGDGVVRLVDWGYATAEEARAAWPDAQHTAEFAVPQHLKPPQ